MRKLTARLMTGAIVLLGAIMLHGGCGTMQEPVDEIAEKAAIENVIKSSITWAQTKDTAMLYDCFVQDSNLFWFSPDNAGTVDGFTSFQEQVETIFLNPKFRAVSADFKNMRIGVSESGTCAWWACYLDDFNEWDGRPANWVNVRWTGVLEKREGAWKIVQMHFSHAAEDFREG